jgi:hypothetical protein
LEAYDHSDKTFMHSAASKEHGVQCKEVCVTAKQNRLKEAKVITATNFDAQYQ